MGAAANSARMTSTWAARASSSTGSSPRGASGGGPDDPPPRGPEGLATGRSPSGVQRELTTGSLKQLIDEEAGLRDANPPPGHRVPPSGATLVRRVDGTGGRQTSVVPVLAPLLHRRPRAIRGHETGSEVE